MEQIKELVLNSEFKNMVGLTFLLQIVFGFFVLVRGGNFSFYLSLLIPELFIMSIAIAYTQIMKSNKIFLLCCLILMEVGVAMQCILQKKVEGFVFQEQMVLFCAMLSVIMALFFYNKVLIKIDLRMIFYLIWIVTIGVYLILLLFGSKENGVSAWISVKGMSLQLTEFLKPLFVYFNSIVFCEWELSDIKKIQYSVGYLFINIMFSLLIGEMGSAMLMIVIYLIYAFLFLYSGKFVVIMMGGTIGCTVIGLVVGKLFIQYVNRVVDNVLPNLIIKIASVLTRIFNRINIWINPDAVEDADLLYQGTRASEAMALGGWFGNQYSFTVPVEKADYIFVSIILKMGIVMAVIIIILFLAMFMMGIRMYLNTEGKLETGIIAGSVLYLVLQSLFMILGSTGYFLMTGIPIAFLSDGGTALIVEFIFVGLILTLASPYYKKQEHPTYIRKERVDIKKRRKNKEDGIEIKGWDY